MTNDVCCSKNLHRAFARVEASHGMAGVDGVSIGAFRRGLWANIEGLSLELLEERYHPLPLLRFLVAKPDGSPRALAVPTVRDRVAQAALFNIVEPLFEARFEDVSFAYRKGRSVKQAAYRIRELRDQGYRFVVEADIDAFFDEIPHPLLLERVAAVITDDRLLRLVGRWVKAEVYDGQRVSILEKGVPQGSVIAPMLANLFLDQFDEALIARGYRLVRYSDDFIVLSKSEKEARAALEFTVEILEELGLKLDDEDTRVTDFEKGFRYLGLTFVGDSIFAPFDRPPKERRVLYMPPPFDLTGYRAGKRAWP